MGKIQSIVKRTGAVVPFNAERITNAIYRAAIAVGGRDRSTAEALTAEVVQALENSIAPDHIPSVEEIQDMVEKVLIENGHAKVAKAYILYRDERARDRQERAKLAARPSETIPWAKIWHVLDWAVSQDLHTIAGLNARIERGELLQIVEACETAYNQDVENAAEMIALRRDKVKMVIITGPSSSGKTTTTIKIGQRLAYLGLKLVTLNLDNYFYDLALQPKDEFGDYDFETPQALDLKLINEHLSRLTAGEEIMMPYYDFKQGKRYDDRTPMRLGPNEIVLIDSLHGLYPEMTQAVPHDQKFKVYLEPLMQLKDSQGQYVRWTDIRLMRRMLRDAAHRGYEPRQTLVHWHYVRTSEKRNIIPFLNTADIIVNSAMPHELCIYKPRLMTHFAGWTEEFKGDPLREDAYTRAVRVNAMLAEITPLTDDSSVPSDSVLREFIGGSTYKY